MATKTKSQTRIRQAQSAMMGFLATLGIIAATSGPAYAQTSSGTMDMTPLVSVIVAIIPVFIMIALLDKLMGKFSK